MISLSRSNIVKVGSGYKMLQPSSPAKNIEYYESPKTTAAPDFMTAERRSAYLDEIKQEQEEIVNNTVKRCKIIEEDAADKARSLIEHAQTVSGEIMDKAEKKGYETGYKEGFTSGAEEARMAASASIDEIRRFADLVNERLNEAIQSQKKDLIKLSFTIAEKIMRQHIAVSEDAVGAMMDELLSEQNGSLKVYVSEYDSTLQLQMGKAVVEKLKRDWQDAQVVLLQENDCLMIDTEDGTTDAGIRHQLDRLMEVVDAEI